MICMCVSATPMRVPSQEAPSYGDDEEISPEEAQMVGISLVQRWTNFPNLYFEHAHSSSL